MTGAGPTRTALLDNRGTPCAVGLIRAARALRSLATGEVLEIWTRDRVAPVEIPAWVERDGHRLLHQGRTGGPLRGHYVFRVQAR